MYYLTTYPSPIGVLTLACKDDNLVGLWTWKQKYFGHCILSNATENSDMPVFNVVKKWLDRYFKGENPSIKELPIAPTGSPFRQKVWNILCDIPIGKTITYGDIAKKIAGGLNKKSMSAQAVGGAVGHNPISIIIPCHRVVGANKNLTGYAGGIETKIDLLKLEGVDTDKFTLPKKTKL